MHTLLQYCTPRIYPVWLGMLSWQAKKKKKKKKKISTGHRLRLDRGPVIKHYGHAILWLTKADFDTCVNGDDHIRPIWYPVPILMTGKNIPCPAARPYHLP